MAYSRSADTLVPALSLVCVIPRVCSVLSQFRTAFCLLWSPLQKSPLRFTWFGFNNTEIRLSPKFFWKDIQPWARGNGVGHLVGAWQFYLNPYVGRSLGRGVLILGRYPTIASPQKCSPFTLTAFLSGSLNPFACVVLSLGLFPLHYPQSKVCLWGGLRGCISRPGCSLLWRNPLPLPLLPPPLGVCLHLSVLIC